MDEKVLNYSFHYDNVMVKGVKVRRDKAPAEIKIPSKVDGHRVTGINDQAFENCSALTTLIIPDSVDYIGVYAFKNCINLQVVNIPYCVNYIGNYAFFNCPKVVLAVHKNTYGHEYAVRNKIKHKLI